jgi:hypothetical protein
MLGMPNICIFDMPNMGIIISQHAGVFEVTDMSV